MHFLLSSLTTVLQFGVLHIVQWVYVGDISEPAQLVLLGTLLLSVGSFGKRKLPE